jgi:hypothetical protein
MQRDRVTIFEPTICYENLLVRVDILVKKGDWVDLIEVKAKSWDPASVLQPALLATCLGIREAANHVLKIAVGTRKLVSNEET